jgi:hypothetical protein
VFIRIRGVVWDLWRAADQDGVVPEISVRDRRNGAAAQGFFKHRLYVLLHQPRCLFTYGRGCGVAQRAIGPMSGIGRADSIAAEAKLSGVPGRDCVLRRVKLPL